MDIKKYPLKPNPRKIKAGSPDDEIYVTVKIGNGQVGGSLIKQGSKQLAKGDLSEQTYLGKASDLNDEELMFRTNVLDVNHFTNKCVITTSVFNQKNETLFSQTDNGDAPKDGIASFVGNYMVKLSIVLIAILINFSGNVYAQSDLEFDDLETPVSPGFILLDQTPSSIERPTTPQGFGASVLGLLSGSGGAMEVAPFWLTNHKNLTAGDMYNKHGELWQNFSLSAAHIQQDSTGFVSVGARTRLFRTYGKGQIKKLDSLKSALQLLLADVDPDNPDQQLLSKIEAARAEYASLTLKPVFTIDLAGATAGSSPTNSFKNLQTSRWAVWMSLNWRPKGDDFYTTVLGRYIGNNRFGSYADSSNLVDIGARFNYDIGKFSASLEYLQRLNLTSGNNRDNRIAAIGSYQLNDKFYLTATFGKDFEDVDNIIALAGINFGFSRSKVKAF